MQSTADFEGSDGGLLPKPEVRQCQTTQAMRDRLRELSNAQGRDDYDRVVLMLLDDHECLLSELVDARLALVPRVAPDTAFDAAWDTLRVERFSHITSRISIHDARVLFRAVNPNEATRSAALRASAAKLVK